MLSSDEWKRFFVSSATTPSADFEFICSETVAERELLTEAFEIEEDIRCEAAVLLDSIPSVSLALSLLRLIIEKEPGRRRLALLAIGAPPPLTQVADEPERARMDELLQNGTLVLVAECGVRSWDRALLDKIFAYRRPADNADKADDGWTRMGAIGDD